LPRLDRVNGIVRLFLATIDCRLARLHDRFLQGHVDPFRVQSFLAGHIEQGANHVASGLRGTGHAGDPETISATGYFNVESAFDLAQVLVELAAEIGEATVVGGFQDDVLRYV